MSQYNDDYQTVAELIKHLESADQPNSNLESLGQLVGLNPIRTQRLFSRWVGISPKRFQQYLTAKHLRLQLGNDQPLLDLAFENELSGPSRVHDHFVQLYAMTPDQCRQQGKNLQIKHGYHPSPFGECHIAITKRGICWLAFTEPLSRAETLSQLQNEWPNADIKADQKETAIWIPRLFQRKFDSAPLHTLVKGTNFQLKVWEALLKIPDGEIVSYGTLANQIGHPGAARAVGTAIGENQISWLIPCHRVIRASGIIGDYRWGHTRKQAMLARELSSNQALW